MEVTEKNQPAGQLEDDADVLALGSEQQLLKELLKKTFPGKINVHWLPRNMFASGLWYGSPKEQKDNTAIVEIYARIHSVAPV